LRENGFATEMVPSSEGITG